MSLLIDMQQLLVNTDKPTDLKLISLLNKAIRNSDNAALELYAKKFGAEGEQIIDKCRNFAAELTIESAADCLTSLPPEDKYLLLIGDKNGCNAFWLLMTKLELHRDIIAQLPSELLLMALNEKSIYDLSVVQLFCTSAQRLNRLLELLPMQDRYKLLNNPDSINSIFNNFDYRFIELIPKADWSLLINQLINNGQSSLLASFSNNPTKLRIALELMPQEERLNALMFNGDEDGAVNAIEALKDQPDLIEKVIDLLSEDDQATALEMIGSYAISDAPCYNLLITLGEQLSSQAMALGFLAILGVCAMPLYAAVSLTIGGAAGMFFFIPRRSEIKQKEERSRAFDNAVKELSPPAEQTTTTYNCRSMLSIS